MPAIVPEALGFAPERLSRIDTVMQRYVDQRKIAGIVTMVVRRGQIVQHAAYGMAHIEASLPMQPDTIFRIYSMTKPIASVAALMLFEAGCFQLSDPIARYLPAFANVKVLDPTGGSGGRLIAPIRPPSIRDLMTHTAGLSYGFEDNVYLDDLYRSQVWQARKANPTMTLAEMVERIAQLPLASQPGTTFRYSMATDVLGMLVQVVADMPFEAYLKRMIFEPLGMSDTDFFVPAAKIERFAANYGPDAQVGLKVIDAPRTSPYTHATRLPSGGGGLVSTADDYLRFCRLLLNHGELDGVRLLGRKTIELMTLNHLPAGVFSFDDPATGFGLGVNVLLDLSKFQNLGSVGTYGWSGAATTDFWIDPHEQIIGILMLQFMPHTTYPIVSDFRTLVYQALVD